jgi:hypothetical protein
MTVVDTKSFTRSEALGLTLSLTFQPGLGPNSPMSEQSQEFLGRLALKDETDVFGCSYDLRAVTGKSTERFCAVLFV